MEEHVYKNIELTGTSRKSIEDAIQGAIERASQTLKHMRWFEVKEVRGAITEGKIDQWQVTVKVGFSLQE